MAQNMMNIDEIMNDRDIVARILLKNIYQYGNILPDGFSLATHGVGDHITPMRRSNYLRYAAFVHDDTSRNPHFISREDIQRTGAIISNRRIRPLFLESWSGNAESGYFARLVELYNVDDVISDHPDIKALQEHPDSYRPNYVAVQKILGKDVGENPRAIYEHVMARLADVSRQEHEVLTDNDVLENLAACQMFFHEYHIPYFGKEHPLYNSDDMMLFQAKPRFLFDTFMAGAKKYQKFMNLQTKNAEIPQILPEQEGDFGSLHVHVDFVDATVKNPKTGEAYPYEDFDLTGEDAYLFLSAMNHEDKVLFNSERIESGDGKARIMIQYGSGEDLIKVEERTDLKYLSYGNSDTVHGSLERIIFPLCDDEKSKKEVQRCLESFHKEEQSYLEKHADIDAYNHYQAHLYTYICRKSDFESIKDSNQLGHLSIIPSEKLKDYCVAPVGETFKKVYKAIASSDYSEEQYRDYTISRDGIPASMIAFETSAAPTASSISKKPFLYVLKKEDRDVLRAVRDFKVTFSITKMPPLDFSVDNTIMSYGFKDKEMMTGYQAFETLMNVCDKENRASLENIYDGIFSPGENPVVAVSFKFTNKESEPWSTDIYQWGRGALSSRITIASSFGFKPVANKMVSSLCKAAHVVGAYFDITFRGAIQHDHIKVPDYATSVENYERINKIPEIPISRPSRDYYDECYQYFIGKALLDSQNDSVEKIATSVILDMIKSGRNERHINSIAKNWAIKGHENVGTAMLAALKTQKVKNELEKTVQVR